MSEDKSKSEEEKKPRRFAPSGTKLTRPPRRLDAREANMSNKGKEKKDPTIEPEGVKKPSERKETTYRTGKQDGKSSSRGERHSRRPIGEGPKNSRFESAQGKKKFDSKSSKKTVSRSRDKFKTEGDSKINKFAPKYLRKHREDTSQPTSSREGIRLNKYIANSGVCSRREADKLIEEGLISINDEVVQVLGTKVLPGDVVKYAGEELRFEKFVYILMNKPKDFITTVDDPQGRRTVMDLIAKNVKERVYPVGRLDRATTGVLLLTNDGELAKKLTHPSYEVQKIYQVRTSEAISKADMEKLADGVKLEDGFVKPDAISYSNDGSDKRDIGIELHSGKNRVIRRMLEALGYKVLKLDRVMFAGMTKKNLSRGKWRSLSEKEVGFLKMMK